MYENSVMIFGGFVCMLCKTIGEKLKELSIVFPDSPSVYVMGRLLVGIFQSYGRR